MTKVTVYGTNTCPWCYKAKEFFKQNKIRFKDKNVEEDEEAKEEMIEKSGQMGVPVIDIDGKIIVGFDQEAIKKSLKLK